MTICWVNFGRGTCPHVRPWYFGRRYHIMQVGRRWKTWAVR